MSERLRNAALSAVIVVLALFVVFMVATDESPDDRVDRIGSSIRCPVCSGESIADSPSSMALDMMALVEERVASGRTDQQIYDELLGSFTGAVLLDPPVGGATLLLWLAPLGALIAGVGIIAWWRRHPANEQAGAPADEPARSNRRLVGSLIIIGGLAVIIGTATALIQDGASPNDGAADIDVANLDDVSNETMEAVIASNLEDPQIDGMRLALAERYFEVGDYRSAFPHFLDVAQSTRATDDQATIALVRLGWMAYDGNGEVSTATELLDQALEISPSSSVALYIKGQVLWCGAGDAAAASQLFTQILELPDLPSDTRTRVEQDLNSASAGAGCT